MSPVELSPALQTASASSLWAQPSKEWVIPAKPKPGRKPKDTNTGSTVSKKDQEDILPGSRRVQNRAAQRAFRERKQTQLAELQARLHSYEQGEIERNVALQITAKKMKDENEELRKENRTLKEKIARLEQERDEFSDKDKKRPYDKTSPASYPRKRARVDEGEVPSSSLPPSSMSSRISSPGDTASTSSGTLGEHQIRSQLPILSAPPPIDILSFSTSKPSNTSKGDLVEPLNCVLCSPDAPCLCRQINIEQTIFSNHSPLQHHPQHVDQSVHNIPPTANTSILDNLPAFQAPVPIRRKAGTSRANIFPIMSASATSSSTLRCSGDPNDCIACADDNFGKAFCQAVGHTLNSSLPCVDCPKGANQTDEILPGGCCGDITKCGSCGIAPTVSSANTFCGPETIPTDDAWRQLKSHPNVAFADLTLLAEVVARRSRCTGSRVVILPAAKSSTPDDDTSPSHRGHAKEDLSVLLTGSREHQEHRRREPPPQLVPQHVLIECGRRRVREVGVDGVREALRLLDQKFAHTR